MNGLSLKQKLLALTGIIVLGLLLIGLLIVWPTIKKITSLKKEIHTIEMDLEQRYQNSQKLKKTLHELDSVKTELTKIKESEIYKGDELKIITELENLASKNNLEQTINVALQNVPKEELGKHPFSEFYNISFLLNGSFSNLNNYLHDIDTLPYYVIIKDLRLEKRNSNNNEKNSNVTLNFNGFVYVKPKI